jgi:hypothetical protein
MAARLAGIDRVRARLQIERLGLVEMSQLLLDVALHVDRVADRGRVARQLADGDGGLETVHRRIDVRVELIGAAHPAEQRRRDAPVVRALQRVERALVQ